MAQVAGVEPAVAIEHLGRCIGLLEIARHHLGPLDQHQTLLAPHQGRPGPRLDNPHGRARQGVARTAAPVAPGPATGDHWTGFGEAVAHQQLNPNRLKKTIHMHGQGPTTADGRAQPPAHQLPPQLRPDQRFSQPVQGPAQPSAHRSAGPPPPRLLNQGEIASLAPLAPVEPAVGQGRPDQLLALGRHRLEGIIKTGKQRLPEPGHADQIVGPHLLQISAQLLEVRVALAAAAGQEEILRGPLIGMPDRQHAEHPIPRPRCHRHPQGAHLVQQIGVAEGHALGLARGA